MTRLTSCGRHKAFSIWGYIAAVDFEGLSLTYNITEKRKKTALAKTILDFKWSRGWEGPI